MNSSHNVGSILLDSIQGALLAAAEIGGNRLLALDPDVVTACTELQGSCIEINITDLEFELYCHPGSWGIRLSRNPPSREVDASISGRIMALVNLAIEDDKVSTSIDQRVSFQGNIGVAQKLQKILANLDIDWEELLAQQTGDVAAFQIHQQAIKVKSWLLESADSLLQTSSEYLREEARLTPTVVEFDRFRSDVTELKHAAERCEVRLQRMVSAATKENNE